MAHPGPRSPGPGCLCQAAPPTSSTAAKYRRRRWYIRPGSHRSARMPGLQASAAWRAPGLSGTQSSVKPDGGLSSASGRGAKMELPVLRSGLLVFPDMTQLDLAGPYEVLARLPGAQTRLVWKTLDPVRSEYGLTIVPQATFVDCGPLDLVLVPGGPGINPLLEDREVLAFLRTAAADAPAVIGCRATCCARSAPSRSPRGSSPTAISSPAAGLPPASTWRLPSPPRSPAAPRPRRSSWRSNTIPSRLLPRALRKRPIPPWSRGCASKPRPDSAIAPSG